MEIIESIKKEDSYRNFNQAKKSNEDYRILNSIKSGRYFLSIQGSSGHYCFPRQTLPIDFYKTMEFAILNNKKEFFNIYKSKKIKSFLRYNELIRYMDAPTKYSIVFGYVPIELINELYLYLKK